MDFKFSRLNLNAVAQGVGGFAFGNENSASNEDSDGVLPEDRRSAMSELQSLVAEGRAAQMSFEAIGFPVLLNVLTEEHDDVELIRGALETIVSALTPAESTHGQKDEVQPAIVNSDLLFQESESISLFLSMLSEDDFYVRYYTLQIITALFTNSPNRLQEAILSIPHGITRLTDMLMNHEVYPVILALFDPVFIDFIERLEADIRESILGIFSTTKNKVTVLPVDLEQMDKETDGDYVRRLKVFIEKQCDEMQDLLGRNATLAEELVRTGGGAGAVSNPYQGPGSGRERALSETLRHDLQEATHRIEILKSDKAKIEAEVINYKNLARKLESDLKSLSDAYNSLEQSNLRLETEAKALRKGEDVPYPDIEAIRAEAREETEKESEAELNDLLVCLGQEQSKVEKLSSRLIQLGEDVNLLLQGIGGDDAGLEEDEDNNGNKPN